MPSEAPWLPDLDGTPIFATKHEIASLRPEHHAVQGSAPNDHFGDFLQDHQTSIPEKEAGEKGSE
jgi:hypothetical protein